MSISIKTLSVQQVCDELAKMGQPSFRAKQLLDWIYAKNASSYDEMTNLPASLRELLKAEFPLTGMSIKDKQISKDGTQKYVLTCEDGELIETVAMPQSDKDDGVKRLSVCFSTQVGCPMGCAFCATGKEGFTRNLSIGEMVDQVAIAGQQIGTRVSNVVAMGQGEPFLNYDNLIEALRILNDEKYLGIGARRITVSTCGLIDGIKRFALEPEQFTLAISLHAARQEVRDALMPRLENQKLRQLRAALFDYVAQTNRRVTLEYIMIDGVNDAEEDLSALKKFCEGLLCHINLLPMNKTADAILQPSMPGMVKKWEQELLAEHIETTIRNSKGQDIAGACGQLKNTLINK